jgi:hypothetical protein
MATTPSKLIDEVLRLGPAPLLKQAGFKKLARRFFRTDSTSTAHLDFQASQWNVSARARFTINLGRYFPSVAEANGQPIVEDSAKQRLLSAGTRIGHLLPDPQDHWWSIEPDTDLNSLATELVAIIEKYALPYLERISTLEGVAEFAGYNALIGKYPTLSTASALMLLGRTEEALATFREYKNQFPSPQPHHTAWELRHAKSGA